MRRALCCGSSRKEPDWWSRIVQLTSLIVNIVGLWLGSG